MLVAVLVTGLGLGLVAVLLRVGLGLVAVLVTGLGLGLDDDVHPAIITVAPAITTSSKIRCFFILSLPYRRSVYRFRLPLYVLFA